MKNVKQAEKMEKRIAELLQQNSKEILELRGKKAAAEKQRAIAAEKLIEVKRSGNLEDYQALQSIINNTDAEIATCNEFIESKSSVPLVTEEEYQAAINAIMEEHGKVYAKNRARALELLAELQALADDEKERTDYENAVLHRWQNDVYRNKDRGKSPSGGYMWVTNVAINARPFALLYYRMIDKHAPLENLKKHANFEEYPFI